MYISCKYFNKDEYTTWNLVVVWVGSLFIPTAILTIATAIIIYKLTRMRQARGLLTGEKHMSDVEKQLTVMLVVVVIAFLLLRLPYAVIHYIFEFRENIWNPVTNELSLDLWTCIQITGIFASMNYTTNFYLYCLAGSAFRGQFVALICCKRDQPGRYSSYNTHSTSLSQKRNQSTKSENL